MPAENAATPQAKAFTVQWLADGATMLRDMVMDAWIASGAAILGYHGTATIADIEAGKADPRHLNGG